MTHYPFPDSRGTKIALAAFFTAMLFLARDSMFTTAVIGFEKAQFLMLGVICLLGVAFLIVNRRKLPQILKDRRMIVAGIEIPALHALDRAEDALDLAAQRVKIGPRPVEFRASFPQLG